MKLISPLNSYLSSIVKVITGGLVSLSIGFSSLDSVINLFQEKNIYKDIIINKAGNLYVFNIILSPCDTNIN